MNGHGDMRYVTAKASQKVGMFRYDENVTRQNSLPASVSSSILSTAVDSNDYITLDRNNDFSFDITIDGSTQAVTLDVGAADLDKYFITENGDQKIKGDDLALVLKTEIANTFSALTVAEADRKYGMKVNYEDGELIFSSGTTGDDSSISLDPGLATSFARTILGMDEDDDVVNAVSATDNAVRGKASNPAILESDPVILKSDGTMTVSDNIDIEMVVNGVKANFSIAKSNSGYKPSDIATMMEEGINYDTNNDSVSEAGLKLRGVTVTFDEDTNKFSITSPTTGASSVIDIVKVVERATGEENPALLGFANTTRAVGETETWVNLSQHTVNGTQTFVELGNDGYYEEITDPSGVDTTINSETWKPVFLDPGELTFTLNGEAKSPFTGIPFTAKVVAGQDTNIPISDMRIDLTRSSQYGGAFSVLSQSQDGQPEGDLMGLDIGGDGLVNASFSNGTQKSLGKIILANFASPSALRQMGDSSFLASASSGDAKIGEAGSSGFGSIRAGAIERSNVDLTQELVDLITAQRNFQANAKAIETSNTLTQAIIQIRG